MCHIEEEEKASPGRKVFFRGGGVVASGVLEFFWYVLLLGGPWRPCTVLCLGRSCTFTFPLTPPPGIARRRMRVARSHDRWDWEMMLHVQIDEGYFGGEFCER